MTSADSMPGSADQTVTKVSVTLALVGSSVALFGVYWDDAWHTDRGRDTLSSPPHLALYSGVAVAVAVVARWGWRRRPVGWRRSLSGPIGVALVGAGATLGSAPVDEWWHRSFGRDAVLWSPPHLLALVGTIALGSGVLLVVAGGASTGHRRLGDGLAVVAGAGVVGGWQVLVLEYDTDVAQFSAFWYLPTLTAGLSVAALTVQIAVGEHLRWAAAWASIAYTLAMAGVIAVLGVMDFSTPIVPMIVPTMFAADLSWRRNWSVGARSLLFAAVLLVVYLPYLRAIPGGVSPTVGHAVVGLPLSVAAVALTIVVFDPTSHWRVWGRAPSAAAIAAVTMVTVVAAVSITGARSASAHDPGQGVETVPVVLIVDVTDASVDVTVIPETSFADVHPVRVVARRAGRVVEGRLGADGHKWVGRLTVDEDGRWFVYVEGRRGDDDLEAWLPVVVGEDTAKKKTALYIPAASGGTPAAQAGAGVVLLAVAALLLGRVALTVRATSRPRPR